MDFFDFLHEVRGLYVEKTGGVGFLKKARKLIFFFEIMGVCTRFQQALDGDHEFWGYFRTLSFLDPFSDLHSGQKGPQIDFYEDVSVCTRF